MTRDYDTTIARIAGNIASGLIFWEPIGTHDEHLAAVARVAVDLARRIVAQVKATDPVDPPWVENPPHETSDRTMRRAGSPPR